MSTRRLKTKELVKDIFLKHPDWTAGRIRHELLDSVPPADTGKVPKLNAIQKHVEDLKRIHNSQAELYHPWNLGELTGYELNPAVVPILLREQIERQKENHHPLTVWEALWASRLYSTLADLLKDKPEALHESVIYWAGEYTLKEKYDRYSGSEKIDTSEFDIELFNNPDVSRATWLNVHSKHKRKLGRQGNNVMSRPPGLLGSLFYPPSHYNAFSLFPMPPGVDLKRRDKLLKERQKRRDEQLKRDKV